MCKYFFLLSLCEGKGNEKLSIFCPQQIFRGVMVHQFLKVLLQVLVQKSHDLLQEEIVISVYNMAAVDFDAFFSDFLPTFLASVEGIDDRQKAILAENFQVNRVRKRLLMIIQKHREILVLK